MKDSLQRVGDFKFSYKRAKSALEFLRPNLDIRPREKALYDLNTDCIEMPAAEQFVQKSKADNQKHRDQEGEAHYWATLWHEVVHWTGHPNRLNRLSLINRGKDNYAREELIAELGAAFLCSHFGIRGELQYTSYISSWLRGLKGDNQGEILQESVDQAYKAWKWVIDAIERERINQKRGGYTVDEGYPY